MNYKKIVFSISFLVVFSFLSFAGIPNAKAVTVDELTAQIQALLQQIQQLQTQIAQLQGQPAQWCHNFNVNLGIGNSSDDVCALRTVLQKEGFETEDTICKFNEEFASAVSGFQQKYIDEILRPSGLRYGTGYVGKATRAKLNQLYRCGAVSTSTPTTAIPTPLACNVFLTCETGYRPYNTDEKDSQGCPIIKCVSLPAIPPQPPVNTVAEQVKCLFQNSTTKQECYSSGGSSCADISACVVDIKGTKGEQITWKSTCGGYAYTTIDGNNEYAEFQCAASAPVSTQTIPTTPVPTTSVPATPTTCSTVACASGYTPYEIGEKDANGCSVWKCGFITVLSPNGGEQWAKGSTQILQWKSSPEINDVYMKLRKGSDTYPGPEGVVSPGVGNAGTNPGSHQWTIPSTLPDGNDYTIRIINSRGGTILDDSDAPFSIVTNISQNDPPKITGGSTLPPGGLQTGQTVNFSWSAQDSDNDNLVWRVDWGDNSWMLGACPASNPSNGQGWNLTNVIHVWEQAGTYIVKVTVSDCKGGTDSSTVMVNVAAVGTQALTALSVEIIGSQSTYAPGQTIKFNVKGVASDGSIAMPTKGFNVQSWMQKTNPTGETVKIGEMYQSFNASYDSNSGLWNVIMTASSDTSQMYKIEAALYCANYSLGCSSGQINKSFTFSIVAATTSFLENIQSQMASISEAVNKLMEEIKKTQP